MKILLEGTWLGGEYSEHPVITICHDNQRLMSGIKDLGKWPGGLVALSANPGVPGRADRYAKTIHTIVNTPQSAHARLALLRQGTAGLTPSAASPRELRAFVAGLNTGV